MRSTLFFLTVTVALTALFFAVLAVVTLTDSFMVTAFCLAGSAVACGLTYKDVK